MYTIISNHAEIIFSRVFQACATKLRQQLMLNHSLPQFRVFLDSFGFTRSYTTSQNIWQSTIQPNSHVYVLVFSICHTPSLGKLEKGTASLLTRQARVKHAKHKSSTAHPRTLLSNKNTLTNQPISETKQTSAFRLLNQIVGPEFILSCAHALANTA